MSLDGTYSGLKASIADWLNRTDLTSVIPDFITLTEAQMQRRLIGRVKDGLPVPRRMVTLNSSFTINNGDEFENVPTDFGGPISLLLPSTPQDIELDYLDDTNFQKEKARNYWQGSPKYYTVVNGQFQFYPVADAAYTATLIYYNRFPALSNSNTTNWILTDYPDVYLYGALTQSAPYLKNDARITTWGTLFTQAMDDICNADPMPTDKMTLQTEIPLMTRWGLRGRYDINTDS